MIDFWIGAGLLLLVALAFLLLPVLHGRKAQAEEDRTALNVALYEERLAELATQQAAGTLTPEQFEEGRADAARELLEDTSGDDLQRTANMGRAVPLIAAILVPLLGGALYMHWGASDKLQLARDFTEQPRSLEEMIARLERVVEAQPESTDAWYFLARTYMSQERPADAAQAFERLVALAGRQPELLGQWAQALYFAGDRQWTEQIQQMTSEALKADPGEVTSLGLLGIAAFENGRYGEAARFWERLVASLPAEDPSREAIMGGIAQARARMADSGEVQTGEKDVEASETALVLQVEVGLADEVSEHVQPDDAVFIFARAVSGPPMPLAVKRVKVSDLPITVSLGDADAMTPQLRMSGFDEVRLFARVSREGNAMQGQWMGSSEVLKPAEANVVRLTIDQSEAP